MGEKRVFMKYLLYFIAIHKKFYSKSILKIDINVYSKKWCKKRNVYTFLFLDNQSVLYRLDYALVHRFLWRDI
jgi:hypothetical protein